MNSWDERSEHNFAIIQSVNSTVSWFTETAYRLHCGAFIRDEWM